MMTVNWVPSCFIPTPARYPPGATDRLAPPCGHSRKKHLRGPRWSGHRFGLTTMSIRAKLVTEGHVLVKRRPGRGRLSGAYRLRVPPSFTGIAVVAVAGTIRHPTD